MLWLRGRWNNLSKSNEKEKHLLIWNRNDIYVFLQTNSAIFWSSTYGIVVARLLKIVCVHRTILKFEPRLFWIMCSIILCVLLLPVSNYAITQLQEYSGWSLMCTHSICVKEVSMNKFLQRLPCRKKSKLLLNLHPTIVRVQRNQNFVEEPKFLFLPKDCRIYHYIDLNCQEESRNIFFLPVHLFYFYFLK